MTRLNCHMVALSWGKSLLITVGPIPSRPGCGAPGPLPRRPTTVPLHAGGGRGRGEALAAAARGRGARSLVFGGCAFPPVSLGPAGDCPCRDYRKRGASSIAANPPPIPVARAHELLYEHGMNTLFSDGRLTARSAGMAE